MADVAVDLENKNATELTGQGIRAFVMQDFNSAVLALSKASELIAAEHGEEHESLGDVYLYYGKALLGLSREENDALGDAVPRNAEDSEEEEEGEGEGAEAGEDKEEPVENGEQKEEVNGKLENGNDVGTSSQQENGEAEAEGDEEPTDLQVAWEVLELAKKIFEKKGEEGKKQLAETLIVLGEVSLESENFDSAVNDIKQGFDLQKTIYGDDSRTLAETCYKLGMAYATSSKIDEAIQSFTHSVTYLKNRIIVLERKEKDKPDPTEEIEEIKQLIPDIEEKVQDMKNYKEEAIKNLAAVMGEAKVEGEKGESSSSSSSKPVNDISHLIKRKRKVEEEETVENNPAKKPSP